MHRILGKIRTNRAECYSVNKAIENLALAFVDKYFRDEDGEFCGDLYFVEHESSNLHYNLFINDYYFDIDNIYNALRYDIPREILSERYDLALDTKKREEMKRINLKNFYLLKIK